MMKSLQTVTNFKTIFKYINFQIGIAGFAFVFGNPTRLINGYDSFGNTCGVDKNEKYRDFPLSGRNTLAEPYVFFLKIAEWRETLQICVKKCPDQQIIDQNQLYQFYKETNSQLCRYDFNMSLLEVFPNAKSFFNVLGPCPELPIYKG